MKLISHNLQQHWVMAFYKEKDGRAFRGKVLIRGQNELQASDTFMDFFVHQGFSFVYYESCVSVRDYLEQSLRSELRCIQALNTIKDNAGWIFEEQEVTYPLAIEHPCLAVKMVKNLQHALRQEKGKLYLIIDGAKYQALRGQFILPTLYTLNCQWASLLTGENHTGLEDSAPYLIAFPCEDEQTLTQQQFFAFCCENPVGILLRTSHDFSSLSHHLRKFTYMPIREKNTWCFFRFYDPTIFALLISHIDIAEAQHFFNGILAYYYLNKGEPHVLSYHPEQIDNVVNKPLALTPYLQHVLQDEQQALLIAKMVANFPEPVDLQHVSLSPVPVDIQIVQKLNQAFLLGLTHPKALYYFLVAQINFPDSAWVSRWDIAKSYSTSQEIRALHYLELTLNAVS